METIRDLMNTECVVPEWLHDTFLGYGDADAAHYSQMPNQITALDFKDTFLSLDHLRDSFPKYSIKVRAKITVKCNIPISPPSLSLSVPLTILIARCLHSSQLMIVMADIDAQTLSLSSSRLVFPTPTKAGQKRKVPPENQEGEESASETTPTIQVEPYVLPNRGPYPYNPPKK